jgi:outer membrane protein TolC
MNFDGAQRRLARDSAAAALRSAQDQLAEVQRQVRAAAVDALRQWQFALAQQTQAAVNKRLAQQQLDAEVERQRLGHVSQLDLSVAQRTAAAAGVQLRDAVAQVALARIEVARLGGTLLRAWDAEALVNAWIQDALDNPSSAP